MVQILPSNKPTSTSERFAKAFMNAGQTAGQVIPQLLMAQEQKKIQQEQMNRENDAAKRLGLDISGIQDPKLRQEYIKSALQGENQERLQYLKSSLQGGNQESLELLKQQGKRGLLGEKQGFLGKLFEGQPSQQTSGADQEKLQGFNPATIPDSAIAQATAMDPALGRELRAAKDTALREKREQQKFEFEKEKISPEHQRQQQLTKSQAESDVKYYNDLNERRSKQILKKESLDRLEQMTKKNVTGKAYEKFFEHLGLISFTSEGRREYAAEVKNQFTDFKQIAGTQLSASEFFVLSNAYPSADFSPEANKAIIDNLKQVNDTLDKEYEITQRLKKENKGKTPEYLQEKVNTGLQEYVSNKIGKMKDNFKKIMNAQYGIPSGFTLMFDIDGNPLSVPENKVEEVLQLEIGTYLP